MICPNCKLQCPPNVAACPRCGAGLLYVQGHLQSHAPTDVSNDPLRFIIPIGRSWVAILAGYAGLFSVLILPAPFALMLGIAAVLHIRAKPERLGMGRAIFAIATGAIGTVVLLLILVARASR
jgi:hypothetical protein